MALQSEILSGNARLEQVSGGAPSVKKAPPKDDADAVRRIQRALVELGFTLPLSFPNGLGGEPDGIFGNETHRQVVAFQKQSFPNQANQWDGRVGRFTLAKMDELLPQGEPDGSMMILPEAELTASRCRMGQPMAGAPTPVGPGVFA